MKCHQVSSKSELRKLVPLPVCSVTTSWRLLPPSHPLSQTHTCNQMETITANTREPLSRRCNRHCCRSLRHRRASFEDLRESKHLAWDVGQGSAAQPLPAPYLPATRLRRGTTANPTPQERCARGCLLDVPLQVFAALRTIPRALQTPKWDGAGWGSLM